MVRVALFASVCFLALTCAGSASRQQRAVRDAVAAELAQSGVRPPIREQSLPLREEDEEEAVALMRFCLADQKVPAADLHGLFQLNARAVSWDGEAFGAMSGWVNQAFSRSDDEPADYLVFSLPWIDRTLDHAIIYVERRCSLCGFGKYFVLMHDESDWVIAAECDAWVS